MTDETRDKLLLIARDRLRNRPGAYRQFQAAIKDNFEGQRMLTLASALPIVTRQAADFGIPRALAAEAEHLLKIVDDWAKSQPLLPAVESLPTDQNRSMQLAPLRADTDQTGAGGAVVQTPERRLALLRSFGGSAKYERGEWTFKGIGILTKSEQSNGFKRCDAKTIRADLKEAAQAERDAKSAGFASGLGQR